MLQEMEKLNWLDIYFPLDVMLIILIQTFKLQFFMQQEKVILKCVSS